MLAIITGATGGLGGSYVKECLNRGYDVILSATSQQRLDNLKNSLQNNYQNQKIWAKECNLKSSESIDNFFSFLKENNLIPDMLINNAGYILEGSVLGTPKEEILSCIDINCVGTVDFTYRFLSVINPSKRNYVLIVSSMAGYYPMPQMATYGATKAFLTNFSVALRQEMKKKNVFVSAVCPGSMATNDAMKRSIKSQGVGGKLSLQTTDKIAKVSVRNVLKNKAVWVPNAFNKLMIFFSKIFSKALISSVIYPRWIKCEKKRGDYR